MDAKQLGPYRMVRQIGRGGMGAVYQAEHTATRIPAAVKVLLDPMEEDSELRSRFEIEIDTLKRLRHPNIVRLFGFGQENSQLFYAMEYVEGPSLQQLLSKKYRFSYEQVLHVGIGIASALRHAHDRGIIHRDIKPANILLPSDGTIKVSDYGIARFFGGSRLTDANMVIGTIEYMAPEQAQAGPLTPKSDLYSLGALLYALLAGRPPYPARSLPEILKQYQSGPPESVRFKRPDVPTAFDRILLDLLQIKPEERPANAMLLLRRLEALRIPSHPANPFEGVTESFLSSAARFQQKKPDFSRSQSSVDLEHPTLDRPALDRSVQNQPVQNQPASVPDDTIRPTAEGKADFPITDLTSADFELASKSAFSDTSIPVTARLTDRPLNGKSTDFDLPEANNGTMPPPTLVSPNNSSGGGSGSIAETISTDALASLRTRERSGVPPLSGPTQPLNRTFPNRPAEENPGPALHSEPLPLEVNLPEPASMTAGSTNTGSTNTSHFTMVPEEELGRFHDDEPAPNAYVSIKVWIFSLILVIIGVFFWYALRAPSADELYTEIQERIERNEDENGYLSALRSSEKKMNRFLSLYSSDGRAETVRRYLNDLELGNRERKLERLLNSHLRDASLSAVEYAYLESLQTLERNPEEGIRKLEAFISLFDFYAEKELEKSADENSSEETAKEALSQRQQSGFDQTIPGQCVTLAVRRLEKIRNQLEQSQKLQKEFLAGRLEQADALESQDPERAEAIRQAIRLFYGGQPWAQPVLNSAETPENPPETASKPETTSKLETADSESAQIEPAGPESSPGE